MTCNDVITNSLESVAIKRTQKDICCVCLPEEFTTSPTMQATIFFPKRV